MSRYVAAQEQYVAVQAQRDAEIRRVTDDFWCRLERAGQSAGRAEDELYCTGDRGYCAGSRCGPAVRPIHLAYLAQVDSAVPSLAREIAEIRAAYAPLLAAAEASVMKYLE